SYAVVASISDPNYQGTAGGTWVIGKATAALTLSSLSPTYDGTPKTAGVATVPTGLAVNLTYAGASTAPTNAGSYAVVATVNDANYAGSASGTLVIGKGTATIALAGLTQTYDGSPKPVTATTIPANLSVTVTYDTSATVPIAVGSYAISAKINDANYTGSASATLVIIDVTNFASWRDAHFTAAEQSAGLADATADPDGDGLSNLAEYALGTDPRHFTPPPMAILDASGLALTFTRLAHWPDVTYIAESSDGLGSWSPVPLEVLVTGPVETLRARDPLTSGDPSRRFLRLRFELK
ncbi:MAG: hypothetical protein DVB26_08685, partial [Verrucomicrobia bacterium]